MCGLIKCVYPSVYKDFEGASWEDVVVQNDDNQLWQDDWEDEDINDDFTQQLRAQLEVAGNNTSSNGP